MAQNPCPQGAYSLVSSGTLRHGVVLSSLFVSRQLNQPSLEPMLNRDLQELEVLPRERKRVTVSSVRRHTLGGAKQNNGMKGQHS